jgi:vacuolar-type H+-ATPase subunit H
MAQELFQSVQQAEEKADRLLQEAQLKARGLIKDAEAEIKAAERKASLENRTQYQNLLDKQRKAIEKSIEDNRPQALSKQAESLKAARGKLEQASQMIFERIWNDGDR